MILLPFGNSSIIWSKLVLGEVGVLVYMWGGKQGFYPFLLGKRSFLSRWGQGDFVSLRPALLLWKTVFHSAMTRQEYRKILKQVCRDVDKSILPMFSRWMFSWYVALWQITLVLNDGICFASLPCPAAATGYLQKQYKVFVHHRLCDMICKKTAINLNKINNYITYLIWVLMGNVGMKVQALLPLVSVDSCCWGGFRAPHFSSTFSF